MIFNIAYAKKHFVCFVLKCTWKHKNITYLIINSKRANLVKHTFHRSPCFWLVVVFFFVIWWQPAYSSSSSRMSPSSPYLSSSSSSPSSLPSLSPYVLARLYGGLSHSPLSHARVFLVGCRVKKIERLVGHMLPIFLIIGNPLRFPISLVSNHN